MTDSRNQPAPESSPDPNRYPKGWDRGRVEAVIAYYDDLAARGWPEEEPEDPPDPDTHVRVTIPRDLLPEVRKLLAKRAA